MIKLDKAVIVEGKYDKIKLKNFLDTTIITTDGFGVFKNEQKKQLIKAVAEKQGIVILTDSDDAGMLIRNYIKNICSTADIVNVYLPQIKGMEKRKTKPSKQGLLGVEGIGEEIILSALNQSGVTAVSENNDNIKKVTKADLYQMGLSGRDNSLKKRKELMLHLGFPDNLSSASFLEIINLVYGYNNFVSEVEKWESEQVKN